MVLNYRTLKHRREGEPGHDKEYEALILTSGKPILIDKLLPKLQKDGHKVLIFSNDVITRYA
jgi:chromodomain-helicase-DNA-binding protein 7